MDSAEMTLATATDFDAFLVDYVPVTDGVWSLAGIDDDRAVFGWSSFHATRCVEQLAIARNRVAAATWCLADVQKRGLEVAVAKAAGHLARARAELADWEAKARQQEAYRQVTAGAWKVPVID